jgi:hypothetical protein
MMQSVDGASWGLGFSTTPFTSVIVPWTFPGLITP